MKVSDILRVKGNTLFTVTPDESLSSAVEAMSEKDIGSLVVMDHGDLVGMLTFREVIKSIVKNGGSLGTTVNHYNNAHKELKKIDKDVIKIADSSPAVEPLVLARPDHDELQ